MKSGSNKKRKKSVSEDKIHAWLGKSDLSKLGGKNEFERVSFPALRPTDWDSIYDKLEKSKTISIRLPVHTIEDLKIRAIQKGIPYQTLIRLWLTEKLKKAA